MKLLLESLGSLPARQFAAFDPFVDRFTPKGAAALVLTNACFFVPMLVAASQRMTFETLLFMGIGLLSGTYHYCDNECRSRFCGKPTEFCHDYYYTLHMFDHALTFYIIAHLFFLGSGVVRPLRAWSLQRAVVQGFAAMVIFLLMDFPSQHSTTQVNIGCLVLLVWGTWGYAWFYAGREGEGGRHRGAGLPEVCFLPYWRHVAKLACLSIGLFAFFGFGEMLGSSGYAFAHSTWHGASSAVSTVLLWSAAMRARAPADDPSGRGTPVAHYVAVLLPCVGAIGLASTVAVHLHSHRRGRHAWWGGLGTILGMAESQPACYIFEVFFLHVAVLRVAHASMVKRVTAYAASGAIMKPGQLDATGAPVLHRSARSMKDVGTVALAVLAMLSGTEMEPHLRAALAAVLLGAEVCSMNLQTLGEARGGGGLPNTRARSAICMCVNFGAMACLFLYLKKAALLSHSHGRLAYSVVQLITASCSLLYYGTWFQEFRDFFEAPLPVKGALVA